MNTVTVPADEAASLFERQKPLRRCVPGCENCDPSHPFTTLKHTHPFVVHTVNIEATTCETCGGYGVLGSRGPIDDHQECWSCNGDGTVPAVVTLAVECSCLYAEAANQPPRTHNPCRDCGVLGFRPVGVATVKHCWPIVSHRTDFTVTEIVSLPERGWIALHGGGHCTDLTGQVVGTPTPGTFLLELADVTPVN